MGPKGNGVRPKGNRDILGPKGNGDIELRYTSSLVTKGNRDKQAARENGEMQATYMEICKRQSGQSIGIDETLSL